MKEVYTLLHIQKNFTDVVCVCDERYAERIMQIYAEYVCWNQRKKIQDINPTRIDFEDNSFLMIKPQKRITTIKEFKQYIGYNTIKDE